MIEDAQRPQEIRRSLGDFLWQNRESIWSDYAVTISMDFPYRQDLLPALTRIATNPKDSLHAYAAHLIWNYQGHEGHEYRRKIAPSWLAVALDPTSPDRTQAIRDLLQNPQSLKAGEYKKLMPLVLGFFSELKAQAKDQAYKFLQKNKHPLSKFLGDKLARFSIAPTAYLDLRDVPEGCLQDFFEQYLRPAFLAGELPFDPTTSFGQFFALGTEEASLGKALEEFSQDPKTTLQTQVLEATLEHVSLLQRQTARILGISLQNSLMQDAWNKTSVPKYPNRFRIKMRNLFTWESDPVEDIAGLFSEEDEGRALWFRIPQIEFHFPLFAFNLDTLVMREAGESSDST